MMVKWKIPAQLSDIQHVWKKSAFKGEITDTRNLPDKQENRIKWGRSTNAVKMENLGLYVSANSAISLKALF